MFSPTYKSMQTFSLGFSFLVLIFVSLLVTCRLFVTHRALTLRQTLNPIHLCLTSSKPENQV